MIVLNHPQGSDAWLQARVGACTASRFADARERVGLLNEQQATYVNALRAGQSESAAMSIAGYKAKPRASVIERALAGLPIGEPGAAALKYSWLIACETIARQPLDDTFVTYAMQRGRELEPQGRMAYELRTDALIEEASLVLTDDGFFGYSTDGLRDDDGLIEIKCPLSCENVGEVWAHPETASQKYLDQIMGGLWITGRRYCDLVVYCPWLASVGKDLFIQRIERDEDYIEKLEADLMDFRRMVEVNLGILRAPVAALVNQTVATDEVTPGLPERVAVPRPAALALPESIF